jgi:hypothetical protein
VWQMPSNQSNLSDKRSRPFSLIDYRCVAGWFHQQPKQTAGPVGGANALILQPRRPRTGHPADDGSKRAALILRVKRTDMARCAWPSSG